MNIEMATDVSSDRDRTELTEIINALCLAILVPLPGMQFRVAISALTGCLNFGG